MTRHVRAALGRAEMDTWPLPGTATLALLWERLHPTASHAPDFQTLADACQVAGATTPEQARAERHRILEVIAGDARLDLSEHPAWIRHGDGTLEETIHLAPPPVATDPSWLAHLLTCPLPATLAVHITVGVRSREKSRQRRRWQRLRAAVRYKDRRDRLVGSEEEDALTEAAVLDSELAAQLGATVYEVAVYCSIRDPHGDPETFERIVKQTCSDFHGLTNAKLVRGRHLALAHGDVICPWDGRAQLIIEEGWKPLSSPAAGAWLNEYARRARHYALWLTFITQFFADFDSEQGRAMLANHAIALCFPNERRDLQHARDTLALTDTDISEIGSLPSVKAAYSTLYMISKRGRGAVRIAPGTPEYWIASSNPEHDQPRRHAALNATGGDAWQALALLCEQTGTQRTAGGRTS